jgi:lipopolysaccharide/colanic/teichoic acid biosynthesis glycosyltransferase
MKRTFDVVVAAVLLLLTLPLMLIIACAIRVSSPGPTVFRAVRVGRGGHEFMMYKFRSMRLHVKAASDLTVHRDPRITGIGRFLRATKLDELPQVINVLRGDMSIIGPRPESPRYVALYTPEQRQVLNVRPGITGPAQLAFPHYEKVLKGDDPEQFFIKYVLPVKVAINIQYVKHQSFWGDMRILLRTCLAIVHRTHRESAIPAEVALAYARSYAEAGATEPLPGASTEIIEGVS